MNTCVSVGFINLELQNKIQKENITIKKMSVKMLCMGKYAITFWQKVLKIKNMVNVKQFC